MKKADKFLLVKWDDSKNKTHAVGILARIEENYYFISRYKNKEFDGIPGFVPGKLYTSSNEVFDFFKTRVVAQKSDNIDYMDELGKTHGRSLIDSFFIEKLPKEKNNECKDLILKIAKSNGNKSDNEKLFL